MKPERDPVDELLESISDGRAVDWDAAARGIDAQRRSRLNALRDVARIAEFSRRQQGGGEDPAMPERWGHLLLLERIGGGAYAEVFRAWDPALQRQVALKLLRPGADDAALMDEGRAIARIRHPNVVAVHGIDRREGRVGLWMELIRGTDLEQEVRSRGPLAPEDAVRLGVQIGSALTSVHSAGLLHRDVKPANVVRDGDGRFVLTDFGLGQRWDQATLHEAGPSGTPMYMAPEVLNGGPASERSDVYSLGLLLRFAMTGRHPFEATSLTELIRAVANGPRPSLDEARAGLPLSLRTAVERATSPDPEARHPSARQVVEALDAATPKGAGEKRRPMPWVAAAGATLLIAVVALGLFRARRETPASPPAPPRVITPLATYAVEASFLRRDEAGAVRLVTGDRVKPGDRLSLEVRTTRPAWIYVLNEDERGERYLLFPQPSFDLQNPVSADSQVVLPGPIAGRENAWTVTSAGGREYMLVVASPEPVAELEAELERIPAPRPGWPIEYARVGAESVERLRGVGGVSQLPAGTGAPALRSRAFERFRTLGGREAGVQGVWVRQITLENPAP